MAELLKILGVLFISLMSIAWLSGCEEIDEVPAEVNLTLGFEGDIDKNFQFSEILVNVGEIKIEAETETGEIFTLSETLTEENLNISSENSVDLMLFNLPPAIYNRLSMEINLKENQQGNSMVFTGLIRNNNPGRPTEFPLLFEQAGRESVILNLDSFSVEDQQLVVQKGEKLQFDINIEPAYIFQPINPGLLIAAQNVPIEGVKTILINRSNNSDIYQIISSRIPQSFTVSK